VFYGLSQKKIWGVKVFAIFRNFCWGGCDFPYIDVFALVEIRKN
jgi:hypothetical protein